MDPKQDFTEQACKAASEAVAYAVARNVPEMLLDIERQMAIDPDDTSLTVGISLSATRLSEYAVNFKVRGVSWTCKRKHKDEDFPEATIDLDNPDIPHLLDGTGIPENAAAPKNDEEGLPVTECDLLCIRRLREIAEELGVDLYAPCWLVVPNWKESVVKIGEDLEPRPRLVPDLDRVLQAADDGHNIVVSKEGHLTKATQALLEKEGFIPECCFFDTPGGLSEERTTTLARGEEYVPVVIFENAIKVWGRHG